AAIIATEGALEAVSQSAQTDERAREAIAAVLRRLPEALDGLTTSVATGRRTGQRPPALPALDRAIVALWDAVDLPPDGPAPARPPGERVGHAAALLEQVATLVDATADTTAAMVAGRDESAQPRPARRVSWLDAPRGALAAARAGLQLLLHPDLVTRRHALRLALTVTLAQLLGGAFHVNRAQWMTTTVLLVLQPYAGATWQRSAARLGGTVLGGVVAALLAAVVHDPLALAATMFVFAVAAVAVRRIDYALFTFFLTPLFVLLAEPALGDWRLAGVRIVDTLTGGALAVLASRLLWPTYESQGIPTTLGTLLDRVRENLDTAARAAGLLPDDGGRDTHARARRRMGLAANMADAALERCLAEPRTERHDAEALLTVLAEVRRVGVACTGLASLPRHEGPPPAPLAERVAALDAMLADLADAVRTGRTPAPADQGVMAGAAGASRRTAEHLIVSSAAGPLARVARHVLGLHGAVTRLLDSATGARDAA
ncbi:MAG: FUSC family protein, partial [Gemmatirosa sp.]